MVGQQIGAYRVDEYVASGAVGHVYRAWDEARQQTVALKLLKPELMQDERAVMRFWREGQAASQLDHPHLVKVFENGRSSQGYFFMAMEYLDSGSLVDLLEKQRQLGQPLPVETVLTMMQQVARAIDYAHRSGVIHRDLKPSNLLLRTDGSVAVADLGVASFSGASQLTQVDDIVGTPEYMTPEQIRVDGIIDARTDVYAMGIILYEMLAGERPFAGDNAWTVVNKQLHEQPKPIQQRRRLPPAVANIVHTCLQKEPAQRFDTARALYHALREAMEAPAPAQPLNKVALGSMLILMFLVVLTIWLMVG